jgi:hypothetical protein
VKSIAIFGRNYFVTVAEFIFYEKTVA